MGETCKRVSKPHMLMCVGTWRKEKNRMLNGMKRMYVCWCGLVCINWEYEIYVITWIGWNAYVNERMWSICVNIKWIECLCKLKNVEHMY